MPEVRPKPPTAPRAALCLLTAAVTLTAPPLPAQLVDGRLLDEFTEAPVAGALVILLAADGTLAAQTRTDAEGHFEVRPTPGTYTLQVLAAGYQDAEVAALSFAADQAYPIDLLIAPLPLAVEGLEVTAPVYEVDVQRLGLRLDEVRSRLITREMIEPRVSAKDVGEVLEWNPIPGVTVRRAGNVSATQGGSTVLNIAPPQAQLDLCVAMARGRSYDGYYQCATWVLDGRVTREEVIKLLDPSEVEAVLVLTPPEATLLYGTGSYGGAVVVYTRRGRSR